MPNLIEQHWQQPKWYVSVGLKPLSCIFKYIAKQRYQQFVAKRPVSLAVPVVIVGNIHVGGVGKTPMVVALTQALQTKGIKVGLISRGYGRQSDAVSEVFPASPYTDVGDEPLLLVKTTTAPMVVAAKRLEAAEALLAKHQVDVILADDGLQHYALPRDLELVVFPSEDVGKDLDVLPNGPLREPLTRLNTVDAVIVSRSQAWQDEAILRQALALPDSTAVFQANINEGEVYGWNTHESWQRKRLVAVCGIGRPEQFLSSLNNLGVNVAQFLALPDHALLDWNALPSGIDGIITTEKDAVKWQGELPLPVWVLPINATIIPDLAQWVIDSLQLQQHN